MNHSQFSVQPIKTSRSADSLNRMFLLFRKSSLLRQLFLHMELIMQDFSD